MTDFAYDRIRERKPMPGIIEVIEGTPVGRAIEDLLIVIGATSDEELENLIVYIPISKN